jgi:lysophospholipase L1-like esterase
MINVKQKQFSKLKILSFYVIMIGLTIVGCFGVLEFGLARYYQSTANRISLTAFDPTRGWRLRPGSYSIKPSYTFKHHQVLINKYGLRNRPITAQTASDTRRIIVLGDSYAFAVAMPNENTFPVILEKILSEHGHYEVLNAGVPGYGTAQEMLFMNELTKNKVLADAYILMISVNDILDNLRVSEYGSAEKSPAQPGFELRPDGTLKRTHDPQKEYSSNFIPEPTSRFYTVEVVRTRLTMLLQTMPRFVNVLHRFGIQQKIPRMPSLIYGWYVDETTEPGVPLMKALIKEIREEAYRNNAVLLVSVIPSPFQVYPDVYDHMLRGTYPGNEGVARYLMDPAKPQRIISEICEELKIPYLNLLPILIQNDAKELYIPADGHLNKEGHAVVAKQLATFVAKYSGENRNRLVPGEP